MSTKKRGLGKGLGALLENSETDITSRYATNEEPKVAGAISSIPVANIEANPFQPRTNFDKEALIELSDSIKEHGIIQPVTVRKLGYDKYQLISGERRFKASQIAGLTEIPAYIRIANDQTMLEMALVENIQRENLDAIEVAISYQRLIDECNLTQEGLSEKIGKKRATVTNYLRLLKLPAVVQLGIRERKITMGHARALLAVDDEQQQLTLYEQILKEGLSVRKVENLSKESTPTTKKKNTTALSFTHQKTKDDLASHFNTKVELKVNNKGKGSIVIPFSSDDDLSRIIDLLDL